MDTKNNNEVLSQIIKAIKSLEEKLPKEETPSLDLMNIKQLATFLNIKESMARKLVFEDSIPTIRIGRCLRFSKKEIYMWIKAR